MTVVQLLLVFVGIPVAILGLITVVVYVPAAHHRPRAPVGPPVGVALVPEPCEVHTDTTGRVTHQPVKPGGENPARADERCWTVACAECGTPFREGADDVHFADIGHAVAFAKAGGWVLAGRRMRCRNCA